MREDALAVLQAQESEDLRDTYSAHVAEAATAITVLHSVAPLVCPIGYFTKCYVDYVQRHRVVRLGDALYSLTRRLWLGTAEACLLQHVSREPSVTHLLQCYLTARREDIGPIVAATPIAAGAVDMRRVAPSADAAAQDPVDTVSRMVLPPAGSTPDAAEAARLALQHCVPEALLRVVRRLCFLPGDAQEPVIVVASGRGVHLIDAVLNTFVDLGVMEPRLVRVLQVGEGCTLQPSDCQILAACMDDGIPVVMRTAVGVPHALACDLRLRLFVVHVKASRAKGCVERDAWMGQGVARAVWEGAVALPRLAKGAFLQHWSLRPTAPSSATDGSVEDVALLSEMMHTGEGGLRLEAGASALYGAVCDAYARYRRVRGYFKSTSSTAGLTLDAMNQAAEAAGGAWTARLLFDPDDRSRVVNLAIVG
jgi:hypothetical protein